MAHQVFISYGHQDKPVADAACARLESRGIRCWIAPRDVLPGQPYGQAISDAIRGCKALVLVFSSHANLSDHVSKEVERAVSNGIPVVPLRIENVAPTGALDYFIGSVHWLDALTPPMEQHLEHLADSIQRLIGPDRHPEPRPAPTVVSPQPAPSNRIAIYAGLGVLGIAVLVAGFTMLGSRTGADNGSVSAVSSAEPATPVTPPAQSASSNPVSPAASNQSTPSAPGSAPASNQASITGCWVWNNVFVRMEADGRITGSPLEATWRSAGGNQFTLHWPVVEDTVALSNNGASLHAMNNYGQQASGQRISSGPSGPRSLIGVWKYSNGILMTFSDDGSASWGSVRGRWTTAEGPTYKVSWVNDPPVDRVTLSPDGQGLSGQNQFGMQVSGTRATCPN
jgi:hypothetical protein